VQRERYSRFSIFVARVPFCLWKREMCDKLKYRSHADEKINNVDRVVVT
jgi:hypothetical protein